MVASHESSQESTPQSSQESTPRRAHRWPLAAVLLLAGLLFSTSAHEAQHGTPRTDRVDSTALYTTEQARGQQAADRVARLTRQIDGLTAAEGRANGTVARLQAEVAALAQPAGLTALRGPTLTVTLDDAPAGRVREGFRADELVVHQQDLQAVVNALWAGGAEAITLMGRRIIATTAVRCVGNTLLVQDTLYSPPYVVVALGDPEALRRGLDTSPEVGVYREYVRQVGLGYDVRDGGIQQVPGYTGAPRLDHARPLP
ncbi:MAG: DUF881 domain-containing protein [Kineosporiaceae bacterium]|nr:DUF881 domain-containing protein [Kineosporiaceae bacterium]